MFQMLSHPPPCRLQHRRCAGAPPRRRTAAAAGDKAAALADLKQSQDGLTSHLEGVEKGMKAEARSSAPAPLDSYDETDLEEIYIENYHQRIKEADSPVVCVDFYTKWCGPCKIIYPKLVEMKETHAGEVRATPPVATLLRHHGAGAGALAVLP